MSDHEEEFYYTEIEVNVDNVTKTFSDMFTSSPPENDYMEQIRFIPDHDYQRKMEVPDRRPETLDMKVKQNRDIVRSILNIISHF